MENTIKRYKKMENQRKTPLLFADVLNRKRMFGTTNFATEKHRKLLFVAIIM